MVLEDVVSEKFFVFAVRVPRRRNVTPASGRVAFLRKVKVQHVSWGQIPNNVFTSEGRRSKRFDFRSDFHLFVVQGRARRVVFFAFDLGGFGQTTGARYLFRNRNSEVMGGKVVRDLEISYLVFGRTNPAVVQLRGKVLTRARFRGRRCEKLFRTSGQKKNQHDGRENPEHGTDHILVLKSLASGPLAFGSKFLFHKQLSLFRSHSLRDHEPFDFATFDRPRLDPLPTHRWRKRSEKFPSPG